MKRKESTWPPQSVPKLLRRESAEDTKRELRENRWKRENSTFESFGDQIDKCYASLPYRSYRSYEIFQHMVDQLQRETDMSIMRAKELQRKALYVASLLDLLQLIREFPITYQRQFFSHLRDQERYHLRNKEKDLRGFNEQVERCEALEHARDQFIATLSTLKKLKDPLYDPRGTASLLMEMFTPKRANV